MEYRQASGQQLLPGREGAVIFVRRKQDSVPDDALAATIAIEATDALFDPSGAQRQIEMYNRVGEAEIEAFFGGSVDGEDRRVRRLFELRPDILVSIGSAA